MEKISFTDILGLNFYPPTPAAKNVPNWYKNTDSYWTGNKLYNEQGATPATIKKCVPVFDAITAGYIIYTQTDVQVTKRDGSSFFQWKTHDTIEFHPIVQAPLLPKNNGMPYPKWINSYSVKTSSGYSTLFIPPILADNPIFQIIPGLVDTDRYHGTVNFPFTLNDPNWEGVIPAGTSIAQAIPIKRDIWQMEIGSEKNIIEVQKQRLKINSKLFNAYKDIFWKRKEYR